MLLCNVRRRQHKCIQTQQILIAKQTIQKHSSKMASSTCYYNNRVVVSMIPFFVVFLFVASSSLTSVLSLPTSTSTTTATNLSDSGYRKPTNQTFKPRREVVKLRRINAYLNKINKPAVKTIQAIFLFINIKV